MAGAVVAGVGRDGHLAEGGGVADGAGAVEGGAARGRHEHVARAPVLALLAPGGAGVLVLAVLAHVVRSAPRKKWANNPSLKIIKYNIYRYNNIFSDFFIVLV